MPTIEPSQPIWNVTLMLTLLLQIYLFLYALSLVTELRRLRHESHMFPGLFRLQGWWFQGWTWRVPARRFRNCKSTRTKSNSSWTWKIHIALGCSLHV